MIEIDELLVLHVTLVGSIDVKVDVTDCGGPPTCSVSALGATTSVGVTHVNVVLAVSVEVFAVARIVVVPPATQSARPVWSSDATFTFALSQVASVVIAPVAGSMTLYDRLSPTSR